MSVPAIKVTQHRQPILIFSVPAKYLVGLSYLNPRELDRETGIQRRFKESRAREIAKYIDSPDSVLPNSIIINLELAALELALDDVYDSTQHTLDLDVIAARAARRKGELHGKAGFVIDGQHRLRAFAHSPNDCFPLIVSAMVDLSLAEVAEVFVKINYYQKPVNKSLVFDLLGISPGLFPQYFLLHGVVEQLNEDASSPFFRRIKMLGMGPGFISQASLITAVEKYGVLRAIRSLTGSSGKQTVYNALWQFFTAVREAFPDEWNERSRLCGTIGIRALVRLMGDILTELNALHVEFSSARVGRRLKRIQIHEVLLRTRGFGGEAGVKALYEAMLAQVKG